MTIYTRIASAAFLYLLWAWFAWSGKTPIDGLITAIELGLAGIGAIHYHQTITGGNL